MATSRPTFAATTISDPTIYQSLILSDNPVSYWPMDDTGGTVATDLLGANSGTYTGGVTLAQAPIRPHGDYSALFNGSTGYVDIPYSPSLNTHEFTIEIWCDQIQNKKRQGLMTTVQGDSNGYSWDVHPRSRSSSASGRVRILLGRGAEYHAYEFNFQLVDNTTTYLAITYDGTTLTEYVNGVLNETAITGYQTLHLSQPSDFVIGLGGGGLWPWNGYLSDAAAYDHALSAAQIAAHFAAG